MLLLGMEENRRTRRKIHDALEMSTSDPNSREIQQHTLDYSGEKHIVNALTLWLPGMCTVLI